MTPSFTVDTVHVPEKCTIQQTTSMFQLVAKHSLSVRLHKTHFYYACTTQKEAGEGGVNEDSTETNAIHQPTRIEGYSDIHKL